MSPKAPKNNPQLTVVAGGSRTPDTHEAEAGVASATREIDWSILMARAQGGNTQAYRRLLEEISPYIRSIAMRWCRDASDAEDAVQDVLLTVHAIRHTYDPARPFGPWLVAIANRRMVDRLRRTQRQRAREAPPTYEHETFAAPAANQSEAALERRALGVAMTRLPIGQRRAIELLKLKEMSLKEAAATTGMSIAALKVATHRGLKTLRNLLSGREDRDDPDP
jgi:RNA polymerase sigma-70 factor (ECF subfamily)